MMESHSKPEVYDLLVLVDATYSMSSYLNSLQHSLPQIIEISTLTDCFSRIGLLAYRDYCDQQLLEWSGWLSPSTSLSRDSQVDSPSISQYLEAHLTQTMFQDQQIDLIKMAKRLEPIGGGDGPEATKTGLAMAYELMRTDACTIILLYTDAPPHTPFNGDTSDSCSNLGPERKALKMETSYGASDPISSTGSPHPSGFPDDLGRRKPKSFPSSRKICLLPTLDTTTTCLQ